MDIRNKLLKYILPILFVGSLLQILIDCLYIHVIQDCVFIRSIQMIYYVAIYFSLLGKWLNRNAVTIFIVPLFIILHSVFSDTTGYKIYWYGGWIEQFILLILYPISYRYLFGSLFLGFISLLTFYFNLSNNVLIVIGFYYFAIIIFYSLIQYILKEVDHAYNSMDNMLKELIDESEEFLQSINLNSEVIKQNYSETFNTACAFCYSRADKIKNQTETLSLLFRASLSNFKQRQNDNIKL